MPTKKSGLLPCGQVSAVLSLLLALSGLLTSCGNGQISSPSIKKSVPTSFSSIQTIPLTAVDYGYSMPENLHIQAGLVDIALVNNGSEAHQAQVARMHAGVTGQDVLNALVTQKNQAAASNLLTFVGGPDTVSPGYGQEALLDLSVGQYVLLCFVVGPDGIAHVSKGMLHFFAVSTPVNSSEPPQTDGTLTVTDTGYQLPDVLMRARPQILHVINQGTQSHELNIVRLTTGKNILDISAFFQAPSGPPPFEEMGGFATLQAGGSGWIKIHLEAGNYAVFSSIPDEKTGQSQLSQGLINAFTVQ